MVCLGIYEVDLRTGEGQLLADGEGRTTVGLSFDQRTNYIPVAGGPDGSAYVFDADSGELVRTYTFDGAMLASGHRRDGPISLTTALSLGAYVASPRSYGQRGDEFGADLDELVCLGRANSRQEADTEWEIDEEELELPGVPEDAVIEELSTMSAEDVKGWVEAIDRAAGRDPDELLDAATEEARSSRVSSKFRREDIEKEVSRYERERTLPDDKTLEKIARYEAHLSRQLYQTLHELENLQKHRITGQGVPLARLDVQGISGS